MRMYDHPNTQFVNALVILSPTQKECAHMFGGHKHLGEMK
jgi:hypothetical protein